MARGSSPSIHLRHPGGSFNWAPHSYRDTHHFSPVPGFQLYLIILVMSSEVTADVSSLGLSGWAWTDPHPQHSHFLLVHYVPLALQGEGSKDLKGCCPDGLWGAGP